MNVTQTGDPTYVVKAVVSYSDEDLEPTLTTKVSGTVYQANFKSGEIPGPYPPGTLHQWEVMIGAYTTQTRLIVSLGGVVADADLGGMPLTTLMVNLGGAKMDLDFSTPTYLSMTNITVSCGGANLTMDNIGNTDFGKFLITAGGCGAILDFHGQCSEGMHQVVANMAGNAASILMPMDAGELINAQTVAAAFNVTGEGVIQEIRIPFYKRYVTDDYDEQNVKLNFGIIAAGATVFMNRTE